MIRRFGRGPEEPTLAIDPCMGEQQAWLLRDTLTRRDWAGARDVLVRASHPDDRAFLLETCGAVPGVQDWIGTFTPHDVLAQLVRGCHAVAWAWDLDAQGETRTKRLAPFFARLRLAEGYLYDVIARDPDEGAAWAFLIRSGRGLQLPLEDGEFRFRKATERHPTSLKAHTEWMQTLCRKWSGSDEWMHAFARDAAARGGDGSMLHALVAQAHLEMLAGLTLIEGVDYLSRTDVRRDLRISAGLSIWHPAAEFRMGWPRYLNIFAVAFSQAGDLPAAAAVFERLGDNVVRLPWGFLGEGHESRSFLRARATAFAARR
jgi:hypothetical protein